MEYSPVSLQVPDKQSLSHLFDTNINHYSTAELLAMLGFSNDVDPDELTKITDDYYEKYLSQDRNVADFFLEVQNRLLTYLSELNITSKQYAEDDADRAVPSATIDDGDGFSDDQEEAIKNSLDQFKAGLITSLNYVDTNPELESYEDNLRTQQGEKADENTVIQNFVQSPDLNPWLGANTGSGDSHHPVSANIKQEGVMTRNATHGAHDTQKVIDADVKQGKLNPDMKNVVQRLVNIDSSYRHPLTANNAGSDDFVFRLNDTMTSVLSLTLFSLELPYSWYTFTSDKGMTGMKITTLTSTGIVYPFDADPDRNVGISIPDGNYTGLALLQVVEDALNDFITEMIAAMALTAAPEDLGVGPWYSLSQNPITGKTEITSLACDAGATGCTEGFYPYVIQIVWFDISFETQSLTNATLNANLGWALGYRAPSTQLYPQSATHHKAVTSPSILDTSGTKYIIMKLNDYKQNRLNKGLISIDSSDTTKTALPNYVSTDTIRSRFTTNADIVNVVGGAPRLLTAKQLFTVNAISERNALTSVRMRGNSPDDTDIFAKIPMKKNVAWSTFNTTTSTNTIIDDAPASRIVDFSGPLQNNKREYFGPVDITSMKVTLFDDSGNVLGLNGHDWSFSLIVKALYQY